MKNKTRKPLLLIFLLMSITMSANAQLVQFVYFYASDVPAPSAAKLDRMRTVITDVQAFYAKEMVRHGYDEKTFLISVGANAQPVIHVVRGKRPLATYIANSALIRTDFPEHLQHKDPLKSDVKAVFLGGAHRMQNGAAVALLSCGHTCTYTAIVPTESGNFLQKRMAHELGHCFGLQHNNSDFDKNTFVMNTIEFVNRNVPKLEDSFLEDYEANWLDKQKYFNQLDTPDDPARMLPPHRIDAVLIEGRQHIQFSIGINSDRALHHAQISKSNSLIVLDLKTFDEEENVPIIKFTTRRTNLLGLNSVIFQVIDIEGNIRYDLVHISPLPPKADEPVVVKPSKNIEPEGRLFFTWGQLKE